MTPICQRAPGLIWNLILILMVSLYAVILASNETHCDVLSLFFQGEMGDQGIQGVKVCVTKRPLKKKNFIFIYIRILYRVRKVQWDSKGSEVLKGCEAYLEKL